MNDQQERLDALERTLAWQKRFFTTLGCVAILVLGLGFAMPLVQDAEAWKIKTPNGGLTETTRVQVSGGENTAKIGLLNSNVGIGTATEFGSGDGVVGLANATTVPSSNPTGGGVAYSEGGKLKWRRSDGTVDPLAGCWEYVAEATAGSSTSSLSVSISGNTGDEYWVRIHAITTATGSSTKHYALRINSDTGNNYVYTRLLNGVDNGTSLTNWYLTHNTTTSYLAFASTAVDTQHIMGEGWVRAPTGTSYREANLRGNVGGHRFSHTGGRWNNTTDAITSFQLVVGEGTSSIASGSSIVIWKRSR